MEKPELLDVIPDVVHLGVEDVRSILVHTDPRLGVGVIVAVPPYVVSLLQDKHLVPCRREPLGQHRARKSGAHNHTIPEFPAQGNTRLPDHASPILRSFAGLGGIHAMIRRVRGVGAIHATLCRGLGTIHDRQSSEFSTQRFLFADKGVQG